MQMPVVPHASAKAAPRYHFRYPVQDCPSGRSKQCLSAAEISEAAPPLPLSAARKPQQTTPQAGPATTAQKTPADARYRLRKPSGAPDQGAFRRTRPAICLPPARKCMLAITWRRRHNDNRIRRAALSTEVSPLGRVMPQPQSGLDRSAAPTG